MDETASGAPTQPAISDSPAIVDPLRMKAAVGEDAESVALTKMSVSQCRQCQWHIVKDRANDGTETMRTWKKKQNHWKVEVYASILNILSVDTKAQRFEAEFFLRLMWAEHVSTALNADRFTRPCEFNKFYDDDEPIACVPPLRVTQFEANGVCATFACCPIQVCCSAGYFEPKVIFRNCISEEVIRRSTQICEWRHCHKPGGPLYFCWRDLGGKPVPKIDDDWRVIELRTDYRCEYSLPALLAIGSVLLLN